MSEPIQTQSVESSTKEYLVCILCHNIIFSSHKHSCKTRDIFQTCNESDGFSEQKVVVRIKN